MVIKLKSRFISITSYLSIIKIVFSKVYFFIGIGILIYIFFEGYVNLPPHFNNLLILFLLTISLSTIYYSTKTKNQYFALFVTIILFLIPISWNWRGLVFDEKVFMGIFPLNDGIQYFTDVQRLLSGLNFTYISTRRPIFSGILTFLLWISGRNMQFAMLFFCIGTAISVYFLAREIRIFIGPISAGITTTLLFYCFYPYVGRVYTENIGLNLGALGLALLINGSRQKNIALITLGTFSLSLALNARAGAFFTLPFIIIWIFINKWNKKWLVSLLILGAILSAFAVNLTLGKMIGSSDGKPFSNFNYTLYGLASGYKGWAYIYSVHPGISDNKVLPFALELIQKNPRSLVIGIYRSFKDFLQPETMFRFMYFDEGQKIVSWILSILTILGLFRIWKNRNEITTQLVLFLFLGCFLSISFIPPIDDGIRALTATIPISVLVIGFAFSSGSPHEKIEKISRQKTAMPVLYLGLISFCILGALLIKFIPQSLDIKPQICPANSEPISIFLNNGTYINIVESGPKYSLIPNLRKKDIRENLKGYTRKDYPSFLDSFQEYDRLVKSLMPGESIITGLNLQEMGSKLGPTQIIFLITKTSQIKSYGNINAFCGTLASDSLKNNRFYFDISMINK